MFRFNNAHWHRRNDARQVDRLANQSEWFVLDRQYTITGDRGIIASMHRQSSRALPIIKNCLFNLHTPCLLAFFFVLHPKCESQSVSQSVEQLLEQWQNGNHNTKSMWMEHVLLGLLMLLLWWWLFNWQTFRLARCDLRIGLVSVNTSIDPVAVVAITEKACVSR